MVKVATCSRSLDGCVSMSTEFGGIVSILDVFDDDSLMIVKAKVKGRRDLDTWPQCSIYSCG